MTQPATHLPASLVERITRDSQQLQLAGYSNRLEYQPDGACLILDMTSTEGVSYAVVWNCSTRYPTDPPRLTVVQRSRDAFGTGQEHQLQVNVPHLQRWNANMLLLELVRDELEPRLERNEYTRIAPGTAATLPASPVRSPPTDPNQLLDLDPEPPRKAEPTPIGMYLLWLIIAVVVIAAVAAAVMVFVLGQDPATLLPT